MTNINNSLSELANRADFTWATYDIFAWVTAEFFLVIVCGSIPTLRPLINFLRRKLGVKSAYSGSAYKRHTEDSGPHSSSVQLSGFRPDGVENKTGISSSAITRDDIGATELGDKIRIDKSYKVRIGANDSEEELNRRDV